MHAHKSLWFIGLIMALAVTACSPGAANIYSSSSLTPAASQPAGTSAAAYPTSAAGATSAATMPASTAMPSTTESAAATAMPTTAPAAAGMTQPWLASDLLNADVYSAACESVGTVSGLVIGSDSGQVLYIWMSAGEALNLGQQYVLIPWSETALSQGQDTSSCTSSGLVLTASQQDLAAAPSFDAAPDMTAAGWDQAVQTYWNGMLTSALDFSGAGSPSLVTSLDAWRVAGSFGDNFGPLDDLVLNTTTGQVAYIVWAPGGDLFVSSTRLVPVPFSTGKWQADTSQFVLKAQVTADTVNNAPGFQHLSDITNPQSNPQWVQDAGSFWAKVS
jgi:sporulation protein YlmC with PRC-barrel domain